MVETTQGETEPLGLADLLEQVPMVGIDPLRSPLLLSILFIFMVLRRYGSHIQGRMFVDVKVLRPGHRLAMCQKHSLPTSPAIQ